jgi:hypothetical protein
MDEFGKKIDRANERINSQMKEPFLVEPFCAEITWSGDCPLYPPYLKGGRVCEFLTSSDSKYRNYRCPLTCDDFFPILEKGTDKQKEALRHFANMTLRYLSMNEPPIKLNHNQHSLDRLLFNTQQIFEKLGMDEEAVKIKEIYEAQHKLPLYDPVKEEERRKHQEELDREAPKRMKEAVEKWNKEQGEIKFVFKDGKLFTVDDLK